MEGVNRIWLQKEQGVYGVGALLYMWKKKNQKIYKFHLVQYSV